MDCLSISPAGCENSHHYPHSHFLKDERHVDLGWLAEFDRAFTEFCSLGSDDFAPRHDLKGYPQDPSGLLNPIYDAKGRICRLLKVLAGCTW